MKMTKIQQLVKHEVSIFSEMLWVRIPMAPYSFFSIFAQTLRACSPFAQNFAKMGPFPLESRGSGVPLHAVKTHGLSWPLYETLVWKTAFLG